MPIVNATHLAPGPGGKYEPQRAFDWLLELQVPGQEEIKLAVQSAFVPTELNEPIELHYGNEVQFVAGKARFEAGQISVRDFVSPDLNQLISDWRKLVYDAKTGVIHYATSYKRTGNLMLLDPEGAVKKTWHLVGLWPQSVNYGQLDYSQNDVVHIEIALVFDRAYRQ